MWEKFADIVRNCPEEKQKLIFAQFQPSRHFNEEIMPDWSHDDFVSNANFSAALTKEFYSNLISSLSKSKREHQLWIPKWQHLLSFRPNLVAHLPLISLDRVAGIYVNLLKNRYRFIWTLNVREMATLRAFEKRLGEGAKSLKMVRRALSREEKCLPRLRPALRKWLKKAENRQDIDVERISTKDIQRISG